jgi:phenylpyruvate tautomerase PptA (4-oxalocrotonate tautomerase family)
VAQVKVYGARESLSTRRAALSDAIHASLVEAFALPPAKRFQRFIVLDAGDFVYPADRSDAYTIVEISVFEGRSPQAKRALLRALFTRVQAQAGIAPQDLEITIFETPRASWGIRGRAGDELELGYRVEV